MQAVKVNIKPSIIQWAMSQTNEGQLGTKLLNNIKQWIEGSKTPTFCQIEDFSRKTNIPLGYFFLQEPPVENIELLEYRTIDSVELASPSRDLIDTINDMKRVQDWMRDYRRDTGFDILDYVGSLKTQTNPLSIAASIRSDLDLEYDWYSHSKNSIEAFKYVRSQLNECGVIVMLNGIVGNNTHRTLSIDEFRAFTMVDPWAPLIFINGADSQGGKLFSLFHEVTHIWVGEDDLYNDRRCSTDVNPLEVLCNAVASELLVPIDIFNCEWDKENIGDDRERIKSLAKKFRCSDSVVARKALDAKYINKEVYDEIVTESINAYKMLKEARNSKGGDYYSTAKTRLDGVFVRALCESVVSGRTTFTEAYRLTNTSRKTFSEVAMRFGGAI